MYDSYNFRMSLTDRIIISDIAKQFSDKANQTDLEIVMTEMMNIAVNALKLGTNIVADGIADDSTSANAFILANAGKKL